MEISKGNASIAAAVAICFATCAYAAPPPNPTPSDANFNTAGGTDAQQSLTSGGTNTAFGAYSLSGNTTGNNNTAYGYLALNYATSEGNTAIGASAMGYSVGGDYNTTVGENSLMVLSSGDSNVAVGRTALAFTNAGNQNVAVGRASLASLLTGNGNIAIGAYSGQLLSSGDNNIYIGNEGVSGDNRTLRIGKQVLDPTNLSRAFIGGINGATLSGGGSTVLISPSGQLGTVVSSARFKKDVADMGDESSKLMNLRPVTFHYKSDPSQTKQYGLIAEEVAKVFPDLVVRGQNGDLESVQYHELAPMLLNELKKQRAEFIALRDQHAKDAAEMAALKGSLLAQQAVLVNLQQKIDAPSRTAAR